VEGSDEGIVLKSGTIDPSFVEGICRYRSRVVTSMIRLRPLVLPHPAQLLVWQGNDEKPRSKVNLFRSIADYQVRATTTGRGSVSHRRERVSDSPREGEGQEKKQWIRRSEVCQL